MRALQSSRIVSYKHLCRDDHDTDDEHSDHVDHHDNYGYDSNNRIFAGVIYVCMVHALLMHFFHQVKKLECAIQHQVEGIFRRDAALTHLEAEIDAYGPPLFHLGC